MGYSYLAGAFLCFIVLYFISNKYTMIFKVQKAVVPLALFIAYLSLSVLFDSLDSNELRKITIGTTNGIVFSLIFGIICSFTLATIYEISEKSKLLLKCSFVFALIYVAMLLFMSNNIFLGKLENVRDDLFLLVDPEGAYQRPSAFILMQFLLVCSLTVVLGLSSKTKIYKFSLSVIMLLVFILSIIFMTMSQLIGSNSGLVTVCGFLLVWFTYLLISLSGEARISKLKNIGIVRVIFSFVGRNIFFYFILLAGLLFFCAMLMFSFTEVDPEHIRILGFGSGDVSSINSRVALLKGNFVEHFSYNPLLGHTKIDVITTGEGTYIHSIFSILTHLGLVGFALFAWLVVEVYLDIKNTKCSKNTIDVFVNKSYRLFRLFSIPCVLVFATFSAFFTWMPLWFCFGLLGIRFIRTENTRLDLV